MTWHCSTEGPWWKRWRIRLFGLTTAEFEENLAEIRKIRRDLIAEQIEEDREFEEWLEREKKQLSAHGDNNP